MIKHLYWIPVWHRLWETFTLVLILKVGTKKKVGEEIKKKKRNADVEEVGREFQLFPLNNAPSLFQEKHLPWGEKMIFLSSVFFLNGETWETTVVIRNLLQHNLWKSPFHTSMLILNSYSFKLQRVWDNTQSCVSIRLSFHLSQHNCK